jgi:hypothetical protein
MWAPTLFCATSIFEETSLGNWNCFIDQWLHFGWYQSFHQLENNAEKRNRPITRGIWTIFSRFDDGDHFSLFEEIWQFTRLQNIVKEGQDDELKAMFRSSIVNSADIVELIVSSLRFWRRSRFVERPWVFSIGTLDTRNNREAMSLEDIWFVGETAMLKSVPSIRINAHAFRLEWTKLVLVRPQL